jgi:TPR repeat protein
MSNYPPGGYNQQPNSRGYASGSAPGPGGPVPQNYDYRDDRRAVQQQPYGQHAPQQYPSQSRPQGYGHPQQRSPTEYGHAPGPPPSQQSYGGYRGPGSPNPGRRAPPSGLMNARYQGPNGQYVAPNRGYASSPSPTASTHSATSPSQKDYFQQQQQAPGPGPQQMPQQPAGYGGPGPKKPVYGNGYRGNPSAPDISTSMQNMSIQEPVRRPSAPAGNMGYPSYNSGSRSQSTGGPVTPTGQTFYKHPGETGSNGNLMAPPAMQNNVPGRASPVALAQRRAAPGAPPSVSKGPPQASQYAYDSIAYTDDNAPPSPTAVSADYGQGEGYARQPKISTNKIPPSSKAVNTPVSPEYRRDDYHQHYQPQQSAQQYQQQPLQRAAGDSGSGNEYNDTNYGYNNQYQQYPGAQAGQAQPEVQPQQPAVEAKPPPRRQYNTTDPLHEMPEQKNRQLTVEDLELVRKRARVQAHDPKVQLELAKKLVEASLILADKYSDPNTPGRAPDGKAVRKNREAWSAQAYKITKKLVGASYPEALFYFASNYSSGGLGLEVDYEKAYELYVKAAKLDHSEAAYRVAVCNEIGAGTRRDSEKALGWYKKAASLGDVSAMYKLGMISLNGLLGQPRSFTEAVTWLERAGEKADADTPHAVHELGLLYERADTLDMSAINNSGTAMVIQKDERKAFDLFLKAAKFGYAPSQFRLGCSYEYGTLGCQIDPKRSIAWYSKAAEKGEPESELALSGWYLTGSEGILQQSDTEAYLWARRAAEKGLAKAEYALGYFSEVGIGVRADIEEAKKWYFKAAAQKHPKASARLQELRQAETRK